MVSLLGMILVIFALFLAATGLVGIAEGALAVGILFLIIAALLMLVGIALLNAPSSYFPQIRTGRMASSGLQRQGIASPYRGGAWQGSAGTMQNGFQNLNNGGGAKRQKTGALVIMVFGLIILMTGVWFIGLILLAIGARGYLSPTSSRRAAFRPPPISQISGVETDGFE